MVLEEKQNMYRNMLDYNDGDMLCQTSDNIAMDMEGHLMSRVSDNMALDLDTGEIHLISSWRSDEEDE